MANVFVSLPLPAGNGPGTPVDTSTMGRDRTIVVDGTFPGTLIAIEGSVDAGTTWFPITTFTFTSEKVIPIACNRMRTNVGGRSAEPFTASVAVGAVDDGALFVALPMPAGNGAGAPVDVSAHGSFTTFAVAGTFTGAVVAIQGSEDGTDWATICAFADKSGFASRAELANFYRTFVSGRSPLVSFVASAAVGSINDPITSAGTPGIDIQDEGVPIAGNPHTTLNFVGGGVAATDGGGGVATITVPGGGVPIGDPNTQAYFDGAGGLTDDVNARLTLGSWVMEEPGTGNPAVLIDRAKRSLAVGVGTASGIESFAAGGTASGAQSVSEGIGSIASATASHAEGNNTLASNLYAHAEGDQAHSTGIASHAEGDHTVASGGAAHAEGSNTTASNVASHAEGLGTTASSPNAHAEGNTTVASGPASHAEGVQTVAIGQASHASGVLSLAFRVGQKAHSSGQFGLTGPAVGASQTNIVTMTGETPGAAPTESVELLLGFLAAVNLILEDGKAYAFTVSAIAGADQAGPARVCRQFLRYFVVRRDGGVSTIAATGIDQDFGDAATADWTLVASIGAAPDRVVLTFTTGAINSAARVTAEVKFVEIAY